MKSKVIVGMSGGVDSSVAAWLLQEQGYHVEGLFMKNWEMDDHNGFCAAAKDMEDAQNVCQKLNIKLHHVNFSHEYQERVFNYFLAEYEQGRTPNPDVLCNREIKFDLFLQHALNLGADFIATGHYAKVAQNEKGEFVLLKAKDRDKDQTYFLHAINPHALSKTLFPIGDYLKKDIRTFAKKLDLITHDKKDSTGICFIGEKNFKNFLNEFILAKPGNIKNSTGTIIGQHDGLMFYTIGQRQGLGIGGLKNGDQAEENMGAWYVVDKNLDDNTLIVARGQNHPLLFAQGLISKPIHWLNAPPELPITCYAKTRYRQVMQPCIISPEDNNKHYVMFSNPQRAITPGQYAVFYDNNRCLGGAVIEKLIR